MGLPLGRRVGGFGHGGHAGIDSLGNVILNPVRVPPFLGIDLYAIKLHGEMDVVAAGHPGHAALAHDLAALDRIAFVNVDVAHVAVDRLQSVTVVDHHAIAVDSQWRRPDDTAVIRRLNADVLRDRQVIAQVHLLVDLFTLIYIVTQIGEGGLGLGVRLARKGLGEEEVIGLK